MVSVQAGYAGVPDFAPHERRGRALHAFLAASVIAHVAIIAGLPDFLPGYPSIGASVLEVSLAQPRLAPAAAPVQPEPAHEPELAQPAAAPAPRPEEKPRPESQAKAAGGGPVRGVAAPEQDVEIIGSFAVAPSRGIAPVTAVPTPAAEAVKVTPASFDAAYLNNPAPRYPQAARLAGEQGTVMLRVLVMRDGQASRVEIAKSSGYRRLDDAAQDAVWGWRFAPARQGTDPIEAWLQVPVRFRLEDPS